MRSPLRIVPGRLAFAGSALGSSACFSLPLSSLMSSVSGSCAANARAAALLVKVMAKRRSPTVIHMRDSCLTDLTDGAAAAAATAGEPDVESWPASHFPPTTSRPASKLSPRTTRRSVTVLPNLRHLPRIHAAAIDLDPGEGRLDLAKVRWRELDSDRAHVLAQVIHVGRA